MKSTDKFLIGIVAGIVVLVGAAFAVAFLRPKPTYRPEEAPEGVVHNYLLALQQGDYARAYGYLSPTLEGYPASVEAFEEGVRDYARQLGSADTSISLEVLSARLTGERAVVTVQETSFYPGGLFNSQQSSYTFEMQLERAPQSGTWKIVRADSYWSWCWNDKDACP